MTTGTHQATSEDPMASAMNATEQPRHYFGEVVLVDAWHCVLQKGIPGGKRPFDPTIDGPDQRRTCIKISVAPLGMPWTIDQETVDFAKEWLRYTLPSLKKLGIDLRNLRGRFVEIERVATGETYTNKQNEIKDRTAVVFARLFATRDECQLASDALFANYIQAASEQATGRIINQEEELPTDLGQPQQTQQTQQPATTVGMNPEKQFALNALPALWNASGQDKAKFAAMLQANDLINRHYPITHPHVLALMAGAIDEFSQAA